MYLIVNACIDNLHYILTCAVIMTRLFVYCPQYPLVNLILKYAFKHILQHVFVFHA